MAPEVESIVNGSKAGNGPTAEAGSTPDPSGSCIRYVTTELAAVRSLSRATTTPEMVEPIGMSSNTAKLYKAWSNTGGISFRSRTSIVTRTLADLLTVPSLSLATTIIW